MERKSIVFTVTNDLSFDQRMQKIGNALAEKEYNVTIIGRKLPHSLPLDLPFKTKRLTCFFNKGIGFYAEFNIRLFFHLLLFEKSHIYCSVDLDTILPSLLVSKIKKKHLAFDAHEYFTEVPEVVNRPFVQNIWEKIGAFCVPKAHLCYTVGPRLAQIFEEKYKVPFGVIRNMPLLENETPTHTSEESIPFILYQGALNKARGIEHMIKAMKKIPLQFHIVGEGDITAELKTLAKKEGVENKVVFMGFMTPDKLKLYTQNAFLGLNVSEPMGKSYYYSLNNKFFDYVQAGLPALTNKFPEYISLMEEFEVGVLADACADDLAEKVNTLLDNPELYHSLKLNCEKARLIWNWENEKNTLFELYAKLA